MSAHAATKQSATTASAEPGAPAGALPWGRTRRLALREFGPGDHESLVQMHRDPRLRAFLVDDYPLHQREVVQVFLERMAALYRRHEGLGIWHTSLVAPQPAFVGWFNLMPMAEHPGEVEIGSRLLPAAWGSGLALEGGELMLEHAFERLGLARVWGICHPHNRSAQAVLDGLGFAPLGVMPYDGRPARHHVIELNAWRNLRNTPHGTRLRRALRARRTGTADAIDPIEGTAHDHNVRAFEPETCRPRASRVGRGIVTPVA